MVHGKKKKKNLPWGLENLGLGDDIGHNPVLCDMLPIHRQQYHSTFSCDTVTWRFLPFTTDGLTKPFLCHVMVLKM